MSKNIKGKIEKVVRINGKEEAQMLVTFPAALSADIPLGDVIINIEQAQGAMRFDVPVGRAKAAK